MLIFIKILPPDFYTGTWKTNAALKEHQHGHLERDRVENTVQQRGRNEAPLPFVPPLQDPNGSFVAPVFQFFKCACVDLETDRSLKGRMSQMKMKVGGRGGDESAEAAMLTPLSRLRLSDLKLAET